MADQSLQATIAKQALSLNFDKPEVKEPKFLCRVCKKPSLNFCSNCEDVFYCGHDHQAIDWPTHKRECLNSAKYLQSRDAFDRKKNIKLEHIKPLDTEGNNAILVSDFNLG